MTKEKSEQEKNYFELYNKFLTYHIDKFRTENVGNEDAHDYMYFPIRWNRKAPLDEHLFYTFKRYYEDVEEFLGCEEKNSDGVNSFTTPEIYMEEIRKVCNLILLILANTKKGDYVKATQYITKLCGLLRIDNYITPIKEKEITFYKLRKERNLTDKVDFYHIPFCKPQICSSNRFSPSGMPCLYLGYSKEVCMKEMDTKEGTIAEMTIGTRNVIDLTFGFLENEQSNQCGKIVNMFTMWPFLAACYVADDERECVSYHEEYAFPQMLSCFFYNYYNNVDGIRYYTCRNKDLNPEDNTYVNLALFARKDIDVELDICGKYPRIKKYDSTLIQPIVVKRINNL